MNITLSFQRQELPPPFAYAAVIVIEGESEIQVTYSREYLGRGDLSNDEIEAEGFSENDDFTWEGILDTVWLKELKWFNTCELSDSPDDNIYLHIKRKDGDGFPKDGENSSLTFELLQQAILEKGEVEMPLTMTFRSKGGLQYQVEWIFSEKAFLVNKKTHSWKSGMEALDLLYQNELDTLADKKDTAVKFESDWIKVDSGILDQIVGLIR